MERIELTDAELQAQLDELYRKHIRQPLQTGEFTAGMFGRKYGLTHGQTENALSRAQGDGDIELVLDEDGEPLLRQVGRHVAKVYRFRVAGLKVEG